jgi:hypothetical protein
LFRLIRALFFLGIAIIMGFGGVAAFIRVPGLVTFDKDQIRKSSAVNAAVRKFSGSEPKLEAARAPDSAAGAGIKAKKAPDARKEEGKDLSGAEEIKKILDGEDSVRFRKKMKALFESLENARRKMGL